MKKLVSSIFLTLLLVVGIFGFPGSSQAVIDCEKAFGQAPPDNKTYVVLRYDYKDKNVGNKSVEFCVEVGKNDKVASFTEITGGKPITIGSNLAGKSVKKVWPDCIIIEANGSGSTKKSSLGNFSGAKIALSLTENVSCGASKVDSKVYYTFDGGSSSKDDEKLTFVSTYNSVKQEDCSKHSGKGKKTECIAFGHCSFISEVCKQKTALSTEEQQKIASDNAKEFLKERYPAPSTSSYPSQILPTCAFNGTCDNINDLVELFIRFAKSFFGIVGMFAFAFFVYGGFLMITAFGAEDKIKQGKQTLAAAVVGLIIIFSAYILTDFVLDALRVGDAFREIGSLDK
jgi:hypothetical protein